MHSNLAPFFLWVNFKMKYVTHVSWRDVTTSGVTSSGGQGGSLPQTLIFNISRDWPAGEGSRGDGVHDSQVKTEKGRVNLQEARVNMQKEIAQLMRDQGEMVAMTHRSRQRRGGWSCKRPGSTCRC
ncbi:uncharacterized protein LOC135110397 isoform X2 [Scylla paramamosain]|uniref:uncharacterized protein LOC135110397 isoform X2 n=1 Tax=Scylla paramamosain TaxID=85552 RepID=UPI003082AB54